MTDDLLRYYEDELIFIRELAGEFANKYPKVAGRLELSDKESTDPHVERLIQAFAMLSGRIRHKIDDEFPEVVNSLLEVLYPHFLRPIPPIAIAQFRFEPVQSRPTEPAAIKAGSAVHSRPAGGTVCRFKTCYPVTVQPIQVTGAWLGPASSGGNAKAPAEAATALRIQIETLGGLPLDALKIDILRFYLNGEGSPVHRLYELLLTQVCAVQTRCGNAGEMRPLPADCIRPVGFDSDEGILPYSNRSFAGYRLLQEYFAFPEKFLFVDFHGFDGRVLSGPGNKLDITVFFRDCELRDHIPSISQAVGIETFQPGCTPVVNLFEQLAEPIRVSHAQSEYRVIPDLHRPLTTEVFSVEQVTSTASYSEEPLVYEPFYSFRHSYSDARSRCFWYASRRPSMRKDDEGTEVFLSLVDLDFKTTLPPVELISAAVLCTNRDYSARLNWRKEWGELEGEGLPAVQIRCLVKPTPTVRPPMRSGLHWRLISHLSLNRLSIVQGGGLEALHEILRLYCFTDNEDARRLIAGITGICSKASVSRVAFDSGVAFCRGLDVDLEFDEEQYAGSGVFLLASVLERFLGLYSAINSYSRLTARSRQRQAPVNAWPPRLGEQRIL